MLSWVLNKQQSFSDYVILLKLLVFTLILTYVIPSGEFDRIRDEETGIVSNDIIPGSYQSYDKHLGVLGILGLEANEGIISFKDAIFAFPQGIIESADLITMLLICSGVVGILHATGWVDGVIARLIHRFKHRPFFLTFSIFALLSVGASTIGIGDELVPLIPAILLLGRRLGFDACFGLSLLYVSTTVGYAGATTNPFNVFIAQDLADIPLNSGWSLRLAYLLCSIGASLAYLYFYTKKNKNQQVESAVDTNLHVTFSRRHIMTTTMVGLSYLIIIVGLTTYEWSLKEMSTGYLLMGVMAILINRLSFWESAQAVIKGVEGVIGSVVIIGMTTAIQIIIRDGRILDTLIFYMTESFQMLPKPLALEGMYFIQHILGFLIPSSAGQAMATIPLITPVSDQIGISRQLCVLTFQFNSLMDLINPFNGMLLLILQMSALTYKKWMRFALPLFAILFALTQLFLFVALAIDYQ